MDNWMYKVRSNTFRRLLADLEKEVFTDVTIEVGSDGNQRTFKAHRLVLASENSEFERILCGSDSGKITIPDVHPKAFENLIRYCYGESLRFKDSASIRDTYFAAEKFKAKKLQAIVENLLKSESLVKIPTRGTELRMASVKERCLETSRLEKVLTTEEFEIPDPLEDIESIVYSCSDRWLESKIHAPHRIVEWEKRPQCWDDFIFHLSSKVQSSLALLNDSDLQAILKGLFLEVFQKNTFQESTNVVENTVSLEATQVESSQVEPMLEERILPDESGSKDEKEIIVERAETFKVEGEKKSDADYEFDEDTVIREDVIQDCIDEVSSLIKCVVTGSSGENVTKLIKEAERRARHAAQEMQKAFEDLEDSFTELNKTQKAEVKDI